MKAAWSKETPENANLPAVDRRLIIEANSHGEPLHRHAASQAVALDAFAAVPKLRQT